MEKANASLRAPNELARDPWFNPGLRPTTPKANGVVDTIVLAMWRGRKRALRIRDRDKLSSVLILLVTNLINHYLTGGHGQGIPVPRSKRLLGGRPNRYRPFVFPRSFPKMLDKLKSLGFAKVHIGKFSGFPGRSKLSTAQAGAKLIDLIKQYDVGLEDIGVGGSRDEVIILKRPRRGHWDEGEPIDYEDNDTTRRYREELRAINSWLAKADIRFDTAVDDQPVNVHARQLRRNFTLGRFDRGGRLFGGFWENLPKDVRLLGIRIEGEKVIGLDYSHLNPMLAYYVAEAVPPPGDAYTLEGLENYRDGVKKVFNAMLFKHPVKQFPQGARLLFPKRLKIKDVTDAILLRHPKLKGVLLSVEIGHQLQFLESTIMMRVLNECLKRKIVALPVHDGVVVKSSAEKVASEIMRREFKAVTGLNVTVKRELPKAGNLKTRSPIKIDPNLGL